MNSPGRDALIATLVILLALAGGAVLMYRTPAAPAPVALPVAAPAKNAAPADDKVLVVVADDWCPVSCAAADGDHEGYGVELLRDIFSAAGYRVEYSVQPWARAVHETQTGNADIIVGILVSDAPELVYPQEVLGTNTNVFFTRANSSWKYRGIPSLAGTVVAIANEYSFGEPFDGYVRQYQSDAARLQPLFTHEPVVQGVGLLAAGRVDAYLDDRMVVNWTLRQRNIPVALREAGVLSVIPLYAAFSPENPHAAELASVFDAGVRKLRSSGKLKVLLERYGLQDWQPAAP